MIRDTGDILAFSPSLVIDDAQMAGLFAIVADAQRETEQGWNEKRARSARPFGGSVRPARTCRRGGARCAAGEISNAARTDRRRATTRRFRPAGCTAS